MMIKQTLSNLIRHDDGMNMVEYALVGALVSVAAVGVLRLLGPALSGLFTNVNTNLE